jgi:predicted DNA binding protein
LALRSGDVEVSQDVAADDRVVPLQAETPDALRSVAAIPLVHEDVVHGVLCVYADREAAFSDRALESFAVLGETVGFAFAAVQNRRLLMRDTVLELTFRTDSSDPCLVSVADAHGCQLTSLGGIAVDEDAIEYLNVDGADAEVVLDTLVDRSHVHDGRVVNDDDGVLELRLDETFDSLLLDVGARTREVRADATGMTITVEAPTDADPRTIRQMLRRRCPAIELVARREHEREPTGSGDTLDLTSLLTDRQLEVLQTAYLSGYYAWPRDTTAEQLAETLDISSPTLHQHLRRAERNLLDGLLDV